MEVLMEVQALCIIILLVRQEQVQFLVTNYLVLGYGQRGVTNNSRGVIVGQTDPNTDVLQYIEVATLGNAVDFGDMIAAGGTKVSSSGSAA